jgi:hypothetical protein
VLDVAKLSGDDAKMFAASAVPGSVTLPGPAILEPDASFVALIESTWLSHYAEG